MADKELQDALDDSDDEDGSEYEIDLDDDPGGTVMASLHKKVWVTLTPLNSKHLLLYKSF